MDSPVREVVVETTFDKTDRGCICATLRESGVPILHLGAVHGSVKEQFPELYRAWATLMLEASTAILGRIGEVRQTRKVEKQTA